MTGRVLACYNLKGGVGKTTAAVNLAYAASSAGSTTLLWDLDPQAAATFFFRIKPKVRGGGKELLKGRSELKDFIKATNYPGLDLMPADFSYRKLERQLAAKRKRAGRLAKLIVPVRHEYDHVILDCPPALSLVSENVFRAADTLLIPLIPTYLSVRVYERLKTWFLKHVEFEVRLLPFFSMADRRRRVHRETMEQAARNHPELLNTRIWYSAAVERMGRHRAPLQVCAPGSEISAAFNTLWREVQERIEPEPRKVASDPDDIQTAPEADV
ncbi:MAG: ParA family protein [Gammaproteobacteria bacterium]|nr:ParA family protein [Gammaproteobacteria bacterium]